MIGKIFGLRSDPSISDYPTSVVVEHLSVFSAFLLLSAALRCGKLRVFFVNSSKIGLKVAHLLYKANILMDAGSQITKGDLCELDDSRHSREFVNRFTQWFVRPNMDRRVSNLIQSIIPEADEFYRDLLSANITRETATDMWMQEDLIAYSSRLGENMGGKSIVILSKDRILEQVASDNHSHAGYNSTLIVQFALSDTIIYKAALSCYMLAKCILQRKTPESPNSSVKVIGTGACWGTDTSTLSDIFWWPCTDIPASRLKYLFDRSDVQPTLESVAEASAKGIISKCLNYKARGDVPEIYFRRRVPLITWLRASILVIRILIGAVRSQNLERRLLAHLAPQIPTDVILATQYSALGLGAVIHHHERGPDHPTAGIHLAGGIRFGTHWSSGDNARYEHRRTNHLYFAWGSHDARIFVDSGSTTQHLLLSGCALHEAKSSARSREIAQSAADELRQRGAAYVLALFDNMVETPRFYKFFLEWVIDDPLLGIMLKPKKPYWKDMYPDLVGLIKRSMETNRVCCLDTHMWPADVAVVSDVAIGNTSPSAVIVSSLAGARVIFMDYSHVDREPLTTYATLHSLGPNRCVFHDNDTLRRAMEEYYRDPSSNPCLGDATPVIDQFDPFRDGKASKRIGEHVGWYLDGIDSGLSRDGALKAATRNYSDKWGEDKVVLGL